MEDEKTISWPDGGMVAADSPDGKMGPTRLIPYKPTPTFLHCKDCEALKNRSPTFQLGDCWRHPHSEKEKRYLDGCFDGLPIVADCVPKREK